MNKDLSKSYREVNIMLDILGEPFKKRLPRALIKFLIENEDKTHNPKITMTDEGFSGNILTDTYILISMLHINYWVDDPEEKERLKKLWVHGKDVTHDYDVFSNDAYKNQLGVNVSNREYKYSDEDEAKNNINSTESVDVDMNKYSNLFDGAFGTSQVAKNSSELNDSITKNVTVKGETKPVKNSKIKNILSGLFSKKK